MRKPQPLLAFKPRFPVFLLGRNGRPLVSTHGDGKAAIGYSSRQLACEAGELLLEQGASQIGILSVSTTERFQQVVSQLARHDVRYLLWDHLGEEAGSKVVDLGLPADVRRADPSGSPPTIDPVDWQTPDGRGK